jgi:HK97 family phage major capsid protein
MKAVSAIPQTSDSVADEITGARMPKAHPAEFARYAKAIAAGGGNYADRVAAAEEQRATPRVVEAIKAASPGAALSTPNWAGALAPAAGEMSIALIESIRPRRIFYTMATMAVPAEFHSRAVAMAMIAASPHTENEWLPVSAASFEPAPLVPVKAGAIIVVSDTLVRSAAPESFRALRRELEEGAIRATDTRALSIALNGITPTAATAAPLADLRTLLTTVSATGAGRHLFAAAPDTAVAAATVETTAGARVFPGMTPTGGEMLGIPCIVSDAVAAGSLALIDCASFAANEGAVAVDLASGGALQMKTDPTQAAAELVSLFQSNMQALRVVSAFGLRRMRDSAAAVLTGAAAAWVA